MDEEITYQVQIKINTKDIAKIVANTDCDIEERVDEMISSRVEISKKNLATNSDISEEIFRIKIKPDLENVMRSVFRKMLLEK